MTMVGAVSLVGDGILVHFSDGSNCFYSASFLSGQRGIGANQLFIDHDPSHHLGLPHEFLSNLGPFLQA